MEVQEDSNNSSYYFETVCDFCGKKFTTTKQRARQNKTQCCSVECSTKLRKGELNCECVVCGKKLHRKPSYIKKTKNITCSYECSREIRKITMSGENNHQYNLKGSLNSSYKNGEVITYYGYKKILQWDHPFHDCDGRVFEHKLVAEEYLLDDINSIIIDGKRYLSPEYIVHHIDLDRLNNNINNLCILKKVDHTLFHNMLVPRIRDPKTGRILKGEKMQKTKDELRELLFKYIKENNCYYNTISEALESR